MLDLRTNSELEEPIWAILKRGRMIASGLTYFEANESVEAIGGDDYEITTRTAAERTLTSHEESENI